MAVQGIDPFVESVNRYTEWTIACLEQIKGEYRKSEMDPVKRQGRLSALQARIELLKAVPIRMNAHPWTEDNDASL